VLPEDAVAEDAQPEALSTVEASDPVEATDSGEAAAPPIVESTEPGADSVVKEAPGGGAPRGFKERILGVLFMPEWAFGSHDASWGWAKPWLLVATVGILIGAFTLMRVDLGAAVQKQNELVMDQMPSQQRKMIENNPKSKEIMEGAVKWSIFVTKISTIGKPPLFGLVGLLFAGGCLFIVTRFVRGPKTPTDLMRCISLAAFVSVINAVDYLADGVGVLTGNAIPISSPAAFASPISQPVLHTILDRLDPFVIAYYVLLAVAVNASLKVPRGKAVGVAVGAHLAVSLFWIGLAAAGKAVQSLGTMGAG
jgi:hypothetical protein